MGKMPLIQMLAQENVWTTALSMAELKNNHAIEKPSSKRDIINNADQSENETKKRAKMVGGSSEVG